MTLNFIIFAMHVDPAVYMTVMMTTGAILGWIAGRIILALIFSTR